MRANVGTCLACEAYATVRTGETLDVQGMDALILSAGRIHGPALLWEAWQEGCIGRHEVTALVADVWCMTEHPDRDLDWPCWRAMFDAAGYTKDGKRSPRPRKMRRLYRAATEEHKDGHSWTEDRAAAEEFLTRGGRDAFAPIVWVADAEPWRLLAKTHRDPDDGSEAQYVVETDGLAIQPADVPDDLWDRDTFLRAHGITEHVWEARGYRRWMAPDQCGSWARDFGGEALDYTHALIERYFTGPEVGAHQRGTLKRWASQEDGLLMPRHPAPGEARIYPEIRPDRPVRTDKPTRHSHPDADAVCWEGCGVHNGDKTLRCHIHSERRHNGNNPEGRHEHEHVAKYLFPPGPNKEFTKTHDHAVTFKGKQRSMLDQHLTKPIKDGGHGALTDLYGREVIERSDAPSMDGEHSHTRVDKDSQVKLASRIDINPAGWELLETSPVVFFCIEGVIKADAILSAGGAVFNVPSVSLWHAPELDRFIFRYLRDKTVCVVADADAWRNPAVMAHARLVQSYLQESDVPKVHITLPPRDRYEATRHNADGGAKGVDDFLGAYRGDLGDLDVLDRKLPFAWESSTDMVPRDFDDWYRLDRNVDRNGANNATRDARVLRELARHADAETGGLHCTAQQIARIMSVRRKIKPAKIARRVSEAINSLEQRGALTIHGGLTIEEDPFSGLEELTKPRLTIAKRWRPIEFKPPRKLRNVVTTLR